MLGLIGSRAQDEFSHDFTKSRKYFLAWKSLFLAVVWFGLWLIVCLCVGVCCGLWGCVLCRQRGVLMFFGGFAIFWRVVGWVCVCVCVGVCVCLCVVGGGL